MKEHGIGAAVRRLEDRRFVTGRGTFVDDMTPAGVAYAVIVRSPHAHAKIARIDKTPALQAPGVLAVLTGEDVVRAKIGALVCQGFPVLSPGEPSFCPERPLLAIDVVRHVGDYVAVVVAESVHQAKDAGELIAIDYEILPVVTLADADADGAPKVWQEAQDNVSFQLEQGDATVVGARFARAAHVTRLTVHYPRVTANPMEPRSVLAFRDMGSERYTLCSSTQTPFRLREMMSEVLGIPESDLRVVAPDVGGGFGMKSQVYPEDALVLWAALLLDRPVKWTSERGEGMTSDTHGRHQIAHGELALDADGRIQAVRVAVKIDLGAYLSTTAGSAPRNATTGFSGAYVVPALHVAVKAVFTNTTMTASYRGTAKPEASFVLERLIETAAREMGIDPITMRRRNLVRSADMPHATASGFVYDCGDFEQVLDSVLALSDWDGFANRRRESEARGLLRGIGLSLHCQRAGNQSERMEIRVLPSGGVTLHVGTHSHGQGHETVFAQMIHEWMGIDLGDIRVVQGDTDKVLYGRGTFSQRSMMAGGSALKMAADNLIEKAARFASWFLEASEADLEFENGAFSVKGTDRVVTLKELAKQSYKGKAIPAELGVGLDGVGSHPGPWTFPNGCFVCEVEVDVETGVVNVQRLSSVDDAGTIINPMTFEGQLHGSVAQGLGEALLEQILYDPGTAQLVTGSFTDYAMPRADNMMCFLSGVRAVPTLSNPLGVKGGSEAGNVGAPAAIVNAIVDALTDFGVSDLPIPATPERVWRAIRSARPSVA